MQYTLRHLQAMTAIARLGCYSVAAEHLHMARPSLSLMIKELEHQLGFTVFVRTTRSVTLTDDGRAFLPHAERVVAEYRNSIWVAKNVTRRADGVLRVASSQLMAGTFLPNIIVEFCARYPNVEVRIVDVPFGGAIEAVVAGEADLGFAPERPLPVKAAASVLFSAPMACLCAADHPFAQRDKVGWDEVAREKIITPSRTMLAMLMHDIGYTVELTSSIEVNHLLTSLALVAKNMGVMPCMTHVRPLLPIYGIRLVPVTPQIRRRLMVVTRAPRKLSPTAEAFCTLAFQMIETHTDLQIGNHHAPPP